MQLCSKALTIAAGVVAAVVVYVLLDGSARWIFVVHDTAALESVKLVSANVGALGAAGLVSLWPSDRRAPLFESLATWAVATGVLMTLAAPSAPPTRDMAANRADVAAQRRVVHSGGYAPLAGRMEQIVRRNTDPTAAGRQRCQEAACRRTACLDCLPRR